MVDLEQNYVIDIAELPEQTTSTIVFFPFCIRFIEKDIVLS